MGQKKASKTSYHHGDLHQTLLDSALRLLHSEGLQNLSLRRVAQLAGVSHTAPYRHFADRETLLAALALVGFEQLLESNARIRRLKHGLDRIQAMAESYIKFALQEPELVSLMFGSEIADRSLHPEMTKADSQALQELVTTIEECQQADLIKKENNALAYALMLWSFLHGFATLLTQGQMAGIKGRGSGMGLARSQIQLMLAGWKPVR